MNVPKSATKITNFFQTNLHRTISKLDTENLVLKSKLCDDTENAQNKRKTPINLSSEQLKPLSDLDNNLGKVQVAALPLQNRSNQQEKVSQSQTQSIPKTIIIKPSFPTKYTPASTADTATERKAPVTAVKSANSVVKKKTSQTKNKAKIDYQVKKILEDIGEEEILRHYINPVPVSLVTDSFVEHSENSCSSNSSTDYSITSDSSSDMSSVTSKDDVEKPLSDVEQLRENNEMLANMGTSWYNVLREHFTMPYFTKLMRFIDNERSSNTVFPPSDQVFAWTQKCSVSDVKVVILGQDPYHNTNQAHGLCFSVQKGVPPPPSLQNMFKELSNDIPGFVPPTHGDLTGWASQGVLLLNAVLTVRAHHANSHKNKGWEKFTDGVIAWINANLSNVVFMLWGNYAQKKGAHIDRRRHCVLSTAHPSPLSVHRGFWNSKHFSTANRYLLANGKTGIKWDYLP